MQQRIVCIVLLPALLLTQWISLARCDGRCHGGGHTCGHHFHLSSCRSTTTPAPGSESSSHHGCCHHRDDVPDQGQDRDDQDDDEQLPTDCPDDGIVFLPMSIAQAWQHGRIAPTFHATLDTFSLAACAGVPDAGAAGLDPQRPPPLAAPADCPTYLRMLTLLI